MEVRFARDVELRRVGEVTVAAFSEFTLGPDDPYVAKLADAATRAAQAELLVAVEDDVVLGTVTVCPPGSAWREIAAPDEGEFRMLAVAPEAQGRGVGDLLARAAVARFPGRRVVISSLHAMTAAHRLYARLGFVRLPERDWSPLPGVDLIAFQRDAD